MALAVELYFDSKTEVALDDLRRRLRELGIVAWAEAAAARPHVSLALVETDDVERLSGFVREFARTAKICPIRLGAVASFATRQNVLYLAPVPTISLLELHYRFHSRLTTAGMESGSLYRPGNWIPHCTLEMGLPDGELARAFAACRRGFEPLDGWLQSAGVVTYPPPESQFETPLLGG